MRGIYDTVKQNLDAVAEAEQRQAQARNVMINAHIHAMQRISIEAGRRAQPFIMGMLASAVVAGIIATLFVAWFAAQAVQ